MRTYPSIFQAWSGIDSPAMGEAVEELVARHDLMWTGSVLFPTRFATEPARVPAILAWRQRLRALNPEIKLLTEIRYNEATVAEMPAGKDWWWKDADGKKVPVWAEGDTFQVDYRLPEVQAVVMAQIKAVVASGCFDGIMFDCWADDETHVAMIKAARIAIGYRLIICNSNRRICPRTIGYMNGVYMECGHAKSEADWQEITAALDYNEAHVSAPKSNCLEIWYNTSVNDFYLMRAATCLALTHSDGYALFCHPNELAESDHLHSWYKFWNKSLGAPVGTLVHERGLHLRKYEKGIAVFNPPGSGVSIYDSVIPMKSVITQNVAPIHAVASPGGGIFLYQ